MRIPFCALFVLIFISSISTAEESGSLNALQNQISQSVQSQSGGAADLMALDLLAGKFKMSSGVHPPEWFTEYYPIAAEMNPDQPHLPRLKLQYSVPSSVGLFAPIWEAHRSKSNASDTTCSVKLNPPTPLFSAPNDNPLCRLDAKEFLIDRSGLASLEKIPTVDKYQEGYISIPQLDGLSQAQQEAAMTQSNFSLPKSTGSVSPIKVKFRKLIAHAEHPQALGKIEVQVGSTLAEIPVDLPPAPKCKVVPKAGYAGPFLPGATVQVELHVDSIVLNAAMSSGQADGNVEMTISERQATHLIGTMRKIGEVSFVAPEEPTPGETKGEGLISWIVSAEVIGVTNNSEPIDCEPHEFLIRKTLPPLCNLSAANYQLALNESTTLTLDCSQPDSGPVQSASINGTVVTLTEKKATLPYQRTIPTGDLVVAAKAIGPAGESNPSLTLTQGAGCRADDPNYLWLVDDKAYGGRYGDWPFRRNYLNESGRGTIQGVTHEITRSIRDDKKPCPADSYCMVYRTHTTGFRRWSFLEVGPKFSPSCGIRDIAPRDIGCFSKDTQILMANGGLKPVAEIRENDFVFNPHYKAGVRVKKVVKGPEPKPLYEVRIGQFKLQVTEDHPFFTMRGWVTAMALKKGDQLLGQHYGKLISSVKKMKYGGPEDVWNFELDTEDPMAHLVIANGIPTGDLVMQTGIKTKKQMNP